MSFVWFLIIGILAGFLAGQIMKGKGFGLLGNLLIGIIGAFIGGHVFGLLGISFHGLLGSLLSATGGAVLLLFIVSLIKK